MSEVDKTPAQPSSNQRFRKKPVIIEAWQFSPYRPYTDLPDWIKTAWFAEEIELDANGRERRGAMIVQIPTLEGVMTARVGDWIIRGVKGEVYPCKPDIFAATYESADQTLPVETPAKPVPCWCPYCGQPHSPAVRESPEKASVQEGARAGK